MDTVPSVLHDYHLRTPGMRGCRTLRGFRVRYPRGSVKEDDTLYGFLTHHVRRRVVSDASARMSTVTARATSPLGLFIPPSSAEKDHRIRNPFNSALPVVQGAASAQYCHEKSSPRVTPYSICTPVAYPGSQLLSLPLINAAPSRNLDSLSRSTLYSNFPLCTVRGVPDSPRTASCCSEKGH